MNRSEALIVHNSRAGTGKAVEASFFVEERLKFSESHDVTDLNNDIIKQIPERVIIIGGDGTIRSTVTWLMLHDEYPLLAIVGGGSGNILKTILNAQKAITPVEELFDHAKTVSFKPGLMETESGEQSCFVIGAGFGAFERKYAMAMEDIRVTTFQTPFKIYIAGLLALKRQVEEKETPILKTYSTSELVGLFKVFPREKVNLESQGLGLVEISEKDAAKAIGKFVISLCCWKLGINPPPSYVSMQYATRFSHDITRTVTSVNVDGDLVFIPKDETVHLTRFQNPFLATSLKI